MTFFIIDYETNVQCTYSNFICDNLAVWILNLGKLFPLYFTALILTEGTEGILIIMKIISYAFFYIYFIY